MKLYIDTSDRDKIIIKLDEKVFETSATSKSSQKVLPFIDEVLKKEKKTTKDITEIGVNIGPGSFTGLRIGVVIANTLGYVLEVPVNGKKSELEINY